VVSKWNPEQGGGTVKQNQKAESALLNILVDTQTASYISFLYSFRRKMQIKSGL
jgi:hypothetical protein